MKILVTGGAGYIGSHTLVELAAAEFDFVVLDNLCNSSLVSLQRVEAIIGKPVTFVEGDIHDAALLKQVFADYSIAAVVHFAGLKSVGESVAQPLRYYENNVYGSQVLFKAMTDAGVFNVVFSSSATVYGEPAEIPISENCPVGRPINPYGRSKLMVEDILCDLAIADPRWRIALLRYFNPVGAHESGTIGEGPNGIPNNLLPFITQVAVGKLPQLSVFGGDYPTHDGTGIRDYIHVVDLAQGHVAALRYLQDHTGVHTWNLGTGQGYSVLDMIKAFEATSGVSVPYKVVGRRDGDIAVCYSNPAKAMAELGWQAQLGLERMIADAWRWQSHNPSGYKDER
ncbi:UDP-glucose 4-epimerase GalE [Vreelandella boliviensis]|uniref:UDP-glucose 4-epimerase n=1 Tax=Vreelandella boliviensis LC1 TaxID=1072583 RepID=A0A265DXF9_9GAMM|nr:UDP-glucose 4-epimerase GalE [Halomonas boliviensis]EHJ93074.1 UDP-glucose 4-epimerase [Halomonas boliviensis LC1]OZT73688.1 UDP-glucose 4-epimerase GalE [Halomonas boliviensis LC1]